MFHRTHFQLSCFDFDLSVPELERGWGKLPWKKWWGVLIKNFKKNPKKYQVAILQTVHIFVGSMPKSTAKTPAVRHLRLNTLRGTKTFFFSPLKFWTSTPILLIWECPPGVWFPCMGDVSQKRLSLD